MAKLSQAPVLESARLKLRAHGLDDFAPCAAMWADPIVARYIGGKPLSEEEAWTKLLDDPADDAPTATASHETLSFRERAG